MLKQIVAVKTAITVALCVSGKSEHVLACEVLANECRIESREICTLAREASF